MVLSSALSLLITCAALVGLHLLQAQVSVNVRVAVGVSRNIHKYEYAVRQKDSN